MHYNMLKSSWPRLLAETVEEPDWVSMGWTKPVEALSIDDVREWCDEYYALEWPQEVLAWMVAGTGNLALFRYLVEKVGLDLEYIGGGGKGGCALLHAARNGMHQTVAYICEHASAAHLAHTMNEKADASHGVGWGSLGALGTAAYSGHAESVRVLLAHGAAVDARLPTSGWTVLHGAAEQGRHECVRLLLAAGADASVRDAAGQTPLDLVDDTGFCGQQHEETRRLLREWATTSA